MVGTYTGLQLIYNCVYWFLSPETQAKYQLIKILKGISWQAWFIGLLVIIICILFEGSFRTMRSRKMEHDEKIKRIQSNLDAAQSELEAERTRNAFPRIKIQIQEIHTETTIGEPNNHPNYIDYYFTIRVYLVIEGLRPISTKRFELQAVADEGNLKTLETPIDRLAIQREQRLTPKYGLYYSKNEIVQENLIDISRNYEPLTAGAGREGWIRFVLPEVSNEQIKDIKAITLRVIDALDNPHIITINKDEWTTSGKLVSLYDQEFEENLKRARNDAYKS